MFALRDIDVPSDWFFVFTLDRGPTFTPVVLVRIKLKSVSSSLGILWSVSLSMKHSFIFASASAGSNPVMSKALTAVTSSRAERCLNEMKPFIITYLGFLLIVMSSNTSYP